MSEGTGITIVSASAGSGKTYRLTQDVESAVAPDAAPALPLEGLIAVTYTRKAHAELAARIRQRLVATGAFDAALQLPLAYLGTVHAMCLRLLQEFALDAGLSPNVDVVTEDAGKLLRQALEGALSEEANETLSRLGYRFQLRYDNQTRRYDWLRYVTDIMDLARGNRIVASDLAAMAERSLAGLFRQLPTSEPDGDAIDDALARELGLAVKALRGARAAGDDTKLTVNAITALEDAAIKLREDTLHWSSWASLLKVTASKPSTPLLDPLFATVARYEAHPRLHAELRELTVAVFDAARVGLDAYRAWKEQRRVVDYVDMLDRALDLVSHPRVATELAARLALVVVDEFQDTSPIQLALFMKLHELARRSIWVGDRKQCIFEYAGADPLLMDAVAAWVERSGGRRDVLDTNYRSRPELVTACCSLFTAALGRHGFTPEEISVGASRPVEAGLAVLPALGVWSLEAGSVSEHAAALAEGVRRLLADPSATPVVDRVTMRVRPVRPGDIAVLVATNQEASDLADALHAQGLRVAIARAGLLATPEGVLVDAALRWLLDTGDTLAAAKIDALLGFGGQSPDAWLESLLPQTPESGRHVAPDADWREALEPLQERLSVLSPAEALDQVLAALDVVQLCARWPDAAQRVANLDSLRGLADDYEGRCGQEREAGTVAGLLRYFDDVGEKRLRRDELIGSDDQHVPTDDGAVIVGTYHKSKGLEWPVVVLSSLNKAERRNAFDVSPEPVDDEASFVPTKPLAGRWIRFWPWAFGGLEALPLASRAEASPEGLRVKAREEKERARLLYVGFTRARDHLVLAARVKSKAAKSKKEPATKVAQTEWLDGLADADGEPLVRWPLQASDGAIMAVQMGEAEVRARVWQLRGTAPAAESPTDAAPSLRPWFQRVARSTADRDVLHRILPSSAHEQWPELVLPTIGAIVPLPSTLPLTGRIDAYDVLGDAIHAFFASDVEGLRDDERHERARSLLECASLTHAVDAAALVEASDRLRAFVGERWPGAVWHREIAIETRVATAHGPRQVGGIIDLLLETPEGLVLFDHKTFPGRTEAAWRSKVVEFLPQFAAYGAALTAGGARAHQVLSGWVHLPVGGAMVEVVLPR